MRGYVEVRADSRGEPRLTVGIYRGDRCVHRHSEDISWMRLWKLVRGINHLVRKGCCTVLPVVEEVVGWEARIK